MDKSRLTIDKYGVKSWVNSNGKPHRKNGPAIEHNDGNKYWYINGKLHREGGPAIEWADGNKYWYINGKLNREDGPAYEGADGHKTWCIDGKFHREDGPAVEFANGNKEWWINDKRHREDGPAIEYASGIKQWYINGKNMSEEKFSSLELIQFVFANIDINISKTDLMFNIHTSIDRTMLTILNEKIDLCDPNSLNQIKECLKEWN